MNISIEFSSTDRSNSYTYSACNSTGENKGFEVFSVVDIMTLVLSLPINSYLISLIVRGIGHGLAAEFFYLNLAVCELCLCVEASLGLLGYATEIFLKILDFFDGFANTGRPLFQCLICVERYLAVVHPVSFLKYKPLRYRLMCCTAAWVTCICSCTFTFITLHYAWLKVYFISWLVQFFFFFSIQLYCCLTVLRALKQSGPGERGREKEEENHMKRRAFHLILITTATTVIIYTPYITLTFFDTCTSENTHIFDALAYICFVFAGLVQPFLFFYRVGKLPCSKSQ